MMGVFLLAMTIGGSVIAAVLLAISVWKGKSWLRNFVLGGVAVWYGFYIIAFLGSSVFSEEKTLLLNEPKEFCGFYLDCHLHTSVSGVRRAKTHNGKTANGEFYIVNVKVFSNAKRATLGFDFLKLFVTDENGNLYPRATEAENAEPQFTQKVPAGGSFEKEVVFDLPADVKNPRLDMSNSGWIEKILVGDEDSFLHKRRFFGLQQNTAAKF